MIFGATDDLTIFPETMVGGGGLKNLKKLATQYTPIPSGTAFLRYR